MFSNILSGRKVAQLIAVAVFAAAGAAADVTPAAAQGTGNTCYACYECTLPDGTPGHYFDGSLAAPGQAGLTYPDDPYVCELGPCSNPKDNRHKFCTGKTASAVLDLSEAVKSGDVVRFAAVMKRDGDIVEYNAERNALQVVGCTGAIVAHIPLKNEALVRLALAD